MSNPDPKAHLRELVAQLKNYATDPPPSDALIDTGVARRAVEAFEAYLEGRARTLDRAFGLTSGPGHPQNNATDPIPAQLIEAYRLACEKMPWKKIAFAVGHAGDPNDLRKRVERHREAFITIEARRAWEKMKLTWDDDD